MTMSVETFRPIPTCEIAPPVLEESPERAAPDLPLPRVLLQAAGSHAAGRRVLLLAALLLGIAILQAAVLLKLPGGDALVVYQELPRSELVEALP